MTMPSQVDKANARLKKNRLRNMPKSDDNQTPTKTTTLKDKQRNNEEEQDSGVGDLWVELAMTLAIAFCISSAVALIQKAILMSLRSFILPA
jgi:hypothetical protein